MEFTEFKALFCNALAENGLQSPTDGVIELFWRFDAELHRTNAVTNLTAIRNTPDAIYKHYVDSLLAADLIPQGSRVLDLGCGPGFPSFPLAMLRPDLTIVALDSTAKKIAFVEQTAKALGLSNLTGVSGRAEDRALSKKLGSFDVVVSRAVARMNVLCELCLPYVKIGGFLLAMKAAKAQEEADEAKQCIQTLGGAPAQLLDVALKLGESESEPRCLIKVEKKKQHPATYPRAYAQILKKPL